MSEQKKETASKASGKETQTTSRTSILRYRPKKYDTRNKADDGKRKYPPKTL